LQQQLKTGKTILGHYHYFTVRDPKERRICAASFPERVLQHAIMNVCDPVFESYAIYDTYACRKGKGLHKAIQRAQFYAKNYPWCLKLDIARYYDNIDHSLLLGFLNRRFKEKALLELFERILATYETFPQKGLPIGNLTSQHFANYYLGIFDHKVKEELRLKGYVRYMDDMLFWEDSQKKLKSHLKLIREYLEKTLHIKPKEGIQMKSMNSGVTFLGYRIFPRKILLARGSRQRFAKKLCRYEHFFNEGLMTESDIARRVEALIGFTRAADALGFRQKVIRDLSGYCPEGLEPGESWRQLEQRRHGELSGCEPQQQRPLESQRQQGFPAVSCPSSTGLMTQPSADQGSILSLGQPSGGKEKQRFGAGSRDKGGKSLCPNERPKPLPFKQLSLDDRMATKN
jgi:hypothetical protein